MTKITSSQYLYFTIDFRQKSESLIRVAMHSRKKFLNNKLVKIK